jgi:hypothetical protein
MARTPSGGIADSAACEGLNADEETFARGLEGVIDKVLERLPSGERLVYGIHQEIGSAIAACLVRRYRAAGWGDVRIVPGATGAVTLVLAP